MMFAEVVVDVKNSAVDMLFTYEIPEHFKSYVDIGSRVLVEFGTRQVIGYVIRISDETSYAGEIKEILDVYDFDKQLTEEQIELAKKIAFETKSLFISALELMYPAFLKSKYRKYLKVVNYEQLDSNIALLFRGKSKLEYNRTIVEYSNQIAKELNKGNLAIEYDQHTYGKNKYQNIYFVSKDKDAKNLTVKRKRIMEYVLNNPGQTIEEVSLNTSSSHVLINDLRKEGFLEVREVIKEEDNLKKFQASKVTYNPLEQDIKAKYDSNKNKPYLLITDDFEFRLKFLEDVISKTIMSNRQVLILAKSIVQSFEIYNFLEKELINSRTYCFNSSLSNNEYFDNYVQVKKGNVDVVVGTISSSFLPLENLGLIIIFDSNNSEYINDYSPKFSTLNVLKWRMEYHKAELILVNETLSVEDYDNYLKNNYILLENLKKENNKYTLVDLRKEIARVSPLISNTLKEKIQVAFNNKKMVALILNQKNYSEMVMCNNCSEVIKCPSCKISLSYNKNKNELSCNYCDYKVSYSNLKCPSCNSSKLSFFNLGLESLEEDLKKFYPDKKYLLITAETMSNYSKYSEAVLTIEEQAVDFIIGTNLVFDLLNYPNISFVALINSDNILNYGDYRAAETLFLNIVKVLNKDNLGLILQGYNLDHYSITLGLKNDYQNFYFQEIRQRNALNYPPKLEIMRLIIGGDYSKRYHAAYYFRKVFRSLFTDSEILGPKYTRKYQGMQLIIKTNDYEKLSKLIDEVKEKFKKDNLEFIFERHPKTLY
ncbi:MAG TPA: primosomal protein N' [Bacilli bacterium]|nr:primosomal protein N' [Bacilli bacterium]HNZ73984.1 primosomal protein N' [Bacilli bacterium]HPX83187.1 primosomal protein N' [Bacilli bacterium]HQB80092.1 primosomal protein N' [Bacilli bacterium]HQM18321.1 primosomal protein N' [Bacilli bacterium]